MPKTRFYKFTGLDKVDYSLSLKEKLFCDAYLEGKANGVEAVLEAGYKVRNRRVAAAIAYENLVKLHISAYINLKLEEAGFNDDNVEKQHLFLLNQFGDLTNKSKAVDMFYKLRGKYAAKEFKLVDENEELDDEQIEKEINRRNKHRKP